ncbi:MAG: hypothetical protein K2M19_09305 [Muribaculaceae bacterium]|nr:hypothetical protein [Muribaculaceae bacterium]
MNKILSNIGLGAMLLSMAACGNEADTPVVDYMGMREITVSVAGPESRTTIDYDGADVSHLVWSEGDEIAYVTDFQGDVWRTAKVKQNDFTAQVPQGATAANRLFVVYPADGVAGKSLGDVELQTLNPAVLDLDKDFDGKRLPMMGQTYVPSESKASAVFDFKSSVVRLCVDSLDHGKEMLKEVTLSANEPLTASYRMSKDGASVTPGSKSITMSVKTAKPDECTLGELVKRDRYVYFVVNRGEYTGLTLKVTTDAGTYTFPNGKMDVSTPGRTLYRMNVTLDKP